VWLARCTTDPPPGLITVPVPKAVLLLTHAEYVRGLKRGEWWKRTQAQAKREVDAVTPKTRAPGRGRRSRCTTMMNPASRDGSAATPSRPIPQGRCRGGGAWKVRGRVWEVPFPKRNAL